MNRRYLKPLAVEHELVKRVLRLKETLRGIVVDEIPVCATTDPEAWHPEHPSGLSTAPYKAEKRAMAMCQDCPLTDFCLLQELREVSSVEQVHGVRGGVRQAERQALYLTLEKEGLL
ncbi:WhiB family transcriptional regulator [Streptomyces sp. NRRL S-118]|uniref:WhiB family transcriptional regulator n=1 Tax=Streptomyces sp. NRRL S-118 TaxID=1463881 RepID=UPI0004C86CF7|nr:WhiB family transcriptional regulator [Streptomyces sp. NRRL S-118]